MRNLHEDKKKMQEFVPELIVKNEEFDWCVPKEYAEEYLERAIAAEKRAELAEKALALACEDNYNSYRGGNVIHSSCVARHWIKYWQDEAKKNILAELAI